MIVKLFRSGFAVHYVMLAAVAALLWIDALISPAQVNAAMPIDVFYTRVINIVSFSPFLATVVGFLACCLTAYTLVALVDQFSLLKKKTLLPGLLYVLLTACSPDFFAFHHGTLTNLIAVILLFWVFKVYDATVTYNQVFQVGFTIAVITMLNFGLVFLLLFMWITFLVFKMFRWRDWLIGLVGFLIPYLFLFTWYLWQDRIDQVMTQYLDFISNIQVHAIRKTDWELALWVYVALLSGVSLFSFFGGLADHVIRVRYFNTTLIWLLGLTVAAWFLLPGYATPMAYFCALPLSIFVSHFLLQLRKPVYAELFVYGLIGLIILLKVAS